MTGAAPSMWSCIFDWSSTKFMLSHLPAPSRVFCTGENLMKLALVDENIPYRIITPSNENIFRVISHLCGEFTDEFPAQRPVTRSFDVFFDLRPNERLSKQPWGWWFDTPSRPLWRHSNRWSGCLLQGNGVYPGGGHVNDVLYQLNIP